MTSATPRTTGGVCRRSRIRPVSPVLTACAIALAAAPVWAAVPVALDDGPFNAQEGGSVTDAVSVLDNDTDADLDPLTAVLVDSPTNASSFTLNPDGTFSYVHDGTETVSDSFTYTANDATDASNIATATIDIAPVNDGPTATAQSVSTAEDTPLDITLAGTDPENDPLTFAVVDQPTNGTLSGTGANRTYTPDANFNGADSFTFTVNDGLLTSAEATVTIDVTAANDAPTATAQSVSTAEDTPLDITLAGTDPENDPLTFAVVDQPTNGTLSGTGANRTYTPDADFNGADSFTFTVNDGLLTSAEATVTIDVTAVNDSPTADDQTVSTPEDTALAITLTGSDPDGDALTFAVATQPANGTLTGTAPDLTYTPDTDFSGDDSFTFTVSDGTATSALATVTIDVTATNDGPTADAQTVSTPEDTPLDITLTGSDPDGDALTFAVVDQPANGTLTGTAPDLTYTPDTDFNGADSFTFTVSDGTETSAAATISITVDSENDGPTADDQTVSTAEDTPLAITLTGSDPDGDALTFAVVDQPTNGTLTGTAPDLTYTPDADFNGADSFTFTVDDGTATSAAATVTIDVTAVNDSPTADAQTVSTPEDTPLDITLTGSDPDGDALTFAVVAQPANGTLAGTAPDLTYTPVTDFNGADSFTFTVSDGTATSAIATVSITVDSENDDPFLATPIDEQFAIEGTPFSLDTAANFSDADGDVLEFSVTGLPDSGSLDIDAATGLISGTPRLEDARDNDPYTVVVSATDNVPGSTAATAEFELNVSALDRANVSLDISVAPNPAMLNDELRWTFTVENASGPQPAGAIDLQGSFVGSGLSVTTSASCTIEAPVGLVTAFDCMFSGLPVGGSASVVLTSVSGDSGDVVAFGTALTTEPLPIDPVIEDNSSQLAVGVAEAFSNGSVQTLTSASVLSVAAGDMNGDGAADLVVGTAAGQPLQVFLSDGFRAFQTPAVSLQGAATNAGLALADFDGDGTLDLAVANGGGQPDRVYRNDGAGNLTAMAELGVTFSQDVAVGDFDGDGVPDLVFATVQGNPVYLGDGQGGFTLAATLGVANSRSVAVGRFDGDALDDIVFANVDGDSQVWNATGAGGFIAGETLAIGDAVSVTVGEFGGDARPDIAFGRVPAGPGDVPSNPVLINDGSGAFGSPVALLGISPTREILSGDVNRDGLTDLVFVNATGVHQIWTASATGFELHREQIVDGESLTGIVAELGMTDVGDPGGADLALGGRAAAGLGVYLNDGFGNLGRGDAVAPQLTLVGDTSVEVPSGSPYSDGGATAEDNIDGDITASIVTVNPVNTAIVGSYTVTYNVSDSAGNAAQPITRTVTVTPAAGTGGGGGGATAPFAILLLISACLMARRGKNAIIRARADEQER